MTPPKRKGRLLFWPFETPVSPGSPMLLRFWAKVCLNADVYPTTRIDRRLALPMTSAGRRLGPLGMDFLERLRIVGPAFVVFDLNVADAPLPPLTGYSDDVQDVGNPRPEGRFPGNACEHEGGAFMHDAKHIRAGGDACQSYRLDKAKADAEVKQFMVARTF